MIVTFADPFNGSSQPISHAFDREIAVLDERSCRFPFSTVEFFRLKLNRLFKTITERQTGIIYTQYMYNIYTVWYLGADGGG